MTRFDRLSELLELRRMRKARRGIDVVKLSSGDGKKRRRRNTEEAPEDKGGLRAGVGAGVGGGEGRGERVRCGRGWQDRGRVSTAVFFLLWRPACVITITLVVSSRTRLPRLDGPFGLTTLPNRPTRSTSTSTCTPLVLVLFISFAFFPARLLAHRTDGTTSQDGVH